MIVPIAAIGAVALYLLFVWLASAIAASYLSRRKGYGEKAGLASGLLLSAIGALAWLFVPAKPDSDWKVVGPLPWQRQELQGAVGELLGAIRGAHAWLVFDPAVRKAIDGTPVIDVKQVLW